MDTTGLTVDAAESPLRREAHGGFGEKSGETEQGRPCHRAPGLLCEYAHVRRLGIVTDTEHQAVDAARDQALAMLTERTGPFADTAAWTAWRWNRAWPTPRLPRPAAAGERDAPTGG
ncbi:hypothetical protein [Streptomyces oryzae]|uniref:hypothetical protein n=1 Tax=Streptomyces oryzae TaxID=1434886 RepID=UPI001FFE251F|nr:hypothetical protein [Streptomyces oryzae]